MKAVRWALAYHIARWHHLMLGADPEHRGHRHQV
jgi:hypothetical protein